MRNTNPACTMIARTDSQNALKRELRSNFWLSAASPKRFRRQQGLCLRISTFVNVSFMLLSYHVVKVGLINLPLDFANQTSSVNVLQIQCKESGYNNLVYSCCRNCTQKFSFSFKHYFFSLVCRPASSRLLSQPDGVEVGELCAMHEPFIRIVSHLLQDFESSSPGDPLPTDIDAQEQTLDKKADLKTCANDWTKSLFYKARSPIRAPWSRSSPICRRPHPDANHNLVCGILRRASCHAGTSEPVSRRSCVRHGMTPATPRSSFSRTNWPKPYRNFARAEESETSCAAKL